MCRHLQGQRKIFYSRTTEIKTWCVGIHAGYIWLQTQTIKICNNYSFSTATMIAGTSLIVTLCVHCLACLTNSGTPKQKAPDNNKVHVSVLKCGSSVWKIFLVVTLAHEIWRHLLDFLKM
jgi:dipeptide/tripeptide permease